MYLGSVDCGPAVIACPPTQAQGANHPWPSTARTGAGMHHKIEFFGSMQVRYQLDNHSTAMIEVRQSDVQQGGTFAHRKQEQEQDGVPWHTATFYWLRAKVSGTVKSTGSCSAPWTMSRCAPQRISRFGVGVSFVLLERCQTCLTSVAVQMVSCPKLMTVLNFMGCKSGDLFVGAMCKGLDLCGRKRVVLRTDSEHVISALSTAVCQA